MSSGFDLHQVTADVNASYHTYHIKLSYNGASEYAIVLLLSLPQTNVTSVQINLTLMSFVRQTLNSGVNLYADVKNLLKQPLAHIIIILIAIIFNLASTTHNLQPTILILSFKICNFEDILSQEEVKNLFGTFMKLQ
uniref:Uncharacterized protein n=1 Tax=Rhizophagus irregularis (strain DAOM 181602 / DAOM 197198 / MUCL 43194) TaxID=747089 RepID=U9SI42_RHIID